MQTQDDAASARIQSGEYDTVADVDAKLAMADRVARAMRQFETGDFIDITDELTELTAEEMGDFLDQVAEREDVIAALSSELDVERGDDSLEDADIAKLEAMTEAKKMEFKPGQKVKFKQAYLPGKPKDWHGELWFIRYIDDPPDGCLVSNTEDLEYGLYEFAWYLEPVEN